MSADICKLPPEILERIFFCMKELHELLKHRLVCRQWDSIITAQNFLNTYFTRRLRSSTIDWYWNTTSDRNTTNESSALISNEEMERKLPPTLHSGRIIAPPKSRHNTDISIYFRATEQVVDKFIDTFSFWAYLPTDQSSINNWFIPYVSFSSAEVRRGCYREWSHFFELLNSVRPQPEGNSWLHIAFTRYLQQEEHTGDEGFDVWLNGRLYKYCIQNGIQSSVAHYGRIHGYFTFRCSGETVTEAARIADLQLFRRPLSKLEIRAIAHQCTSPSNVKVGQYFLQEHHRASDTEKIEEPSMSNRHVGFLSYLIRLFIAILIRLFSRFF